MLEQYNINLIRFKRRLLDLKVNPNITLKYSEFHLDNFLQKKI